MCRKVSTIILSVVSAWNLYFYSEVLASNGQQFSRYKELKLQEMSVGFMYICKVILLIGVVGRKRSVNSCWLFHKLRTRFEAHPFYKNYMFFWTLCMHDAQIVEWKFWGKRTTQHFITATSGQWHFKCLGILTRKIQKTYSFYYLLICYIF